MCAVTLVIARIYNTRDTHPEEGEWEGVKAKVKGSLVKGEFMSFIACSMFDHPGEWKGCYL